MYRKAIAVPQAVRLSCYRYLEVVVAAKARAWDTASTLWIVTIPKTGVLFKQLSSWMKPSLASNDSGFGGGVKIRVGGSGTRGIGRENKVTVFFSVRR